MADLDYTVDVDTRRGTRSLTNFQNQVKATTSGFARLGTAIAGLALGALVRNGLNAADSLGKVANKVGLTVQQLQELRFVAEQSGVATNALDTSIQRFSRRVGEAAQGTGVLRKEFESLGINIRNSEGGLKSTNDLFNEYITAIDAAGSSQEKLRLAVAGFDSEGAALINFLDKGVDGYRALRQEANDLNLILSKDQVEAATRANDAFGRLRNQLSIMAQIAVAELAPALEQITDQVGELLKDPERMERISENFKAFGDTLVVVSSVITKLAENVKALAIAISTIYIGKSIGFFRDFRKGVQQAGRSANTTAGSITRLGTTFGGILKSGGLLIARLSVLGAALTGLQLVLSSGILDGFVDWLDSAQVKIRELAFNNVPALSAAFESFLGLFGDGPSDLEKRLAGIQIRSELATEEGKKRLELAKKLNEERKKIGEGVASLGSKGESTDLNEVNVEIERRNKLLREQATAFLPLVQIQETYRKAGEALQNAFDAGAITQAEYTNGLQRAGEAFQQARDAINGTTSSFESATEAQQNFKNELSTTTDLMRSFADSTANALNEFEQLNMGPLEREIDDIGRDINSKVTQRVRELKAALSETTDPTIKAKLQQQIADISNAAAQAIQAQSEIATRTRDYQRSFSTGWKDAFDEYKDNATNAAEGAQRVFEKTTKGMEDSIVNFAKTGKFEFKDFMNSILEELLRSQVQQLIAKTFGGFGGGGSGGGGLLGGLGSLFGGFFATGGMIPPGRFGVVGENGPELVQGPANVTPNFGGGNVTYNINAVDAMSFRQMVAKDPQFIYSVTEQGRRSLPQSRR